MSDRFCSYGSAQAVEDSFYKALANGDLSTVMAVWADDDEVICIHPGGARLVGLAAVRGAWEEILRNGGLAVQVQRRHCVTGAALAVHNVVEEITVSGSRGTELLYCFATNVYVKDAEGWRLFSHHASPPSDQVEAPLASGEQLH